MTGAHGACGIPVISKTLVNWLNLRNDGLFEIYIYIKLYIYSRNARGRGSKGK